MVRVPLILVGILFLTANIYVSALKKEKALTPAELLEDDESFNPPAEEVQDEEADGCKRKLSETFSKISDGTKNWLKKSNSELMSSSISLGGSLQGASLGSIMSQSKEIVIGGTIENFSRYPFTQVKCKNKQGYINKALRTVFPSTKEAWASHQGVVGTDSEVTCTMNVKIQDDGDYVIQFKYIATNNFNTQSGNKLWLNVCKKNPDKCDIDEFETRLITTEGDNVAPKRHKYKVYYWEIEDLNTCSADNDAGKKMPLCLIGKMGTSHKSELFISVYAQSLEYASDKIQESFKEVSFELLDSYDSQCAPGTELTLEQCKSDAAVSFIKLIGPTKEFIIDTNFKFVWANEWTNHFPGCFVFRDGGLRFNTINDVSRLEEEKNIHKRSLCSTADQKYREFIDKFVMDDYEAKKKIKRKAKADKKAKKMNKIPEDSGEKKSEVDVEADTRSPALGLVAVIKLVDAAISLGTMAGEAVASLMNKQASISVGGQIENYSKFDLVKVKCRNQDGYINKPLRNIASGSKEGFAAYQSSLNEGSWVHCKMRVADDEPTDRTLIHFMFSAPNNFNFAHNRLSVAVCKENDPGCKILTHATMNTSDVGSLYFKQHGRARTYYQDAKDIFVCPKLTNTASSTKERAPVCVVASMGNSHQPIININVYAGKLDGAMGNITTAFEGENLKNSDYEQLLKSFDDLTDSSSWWFDHPTKRTEL